MKLSMLTIKAKPSVKMQKLMKERVSAKTAFNRSKSSTFFWGQAMLDNSGNIIKPPLFVFRQQILSRAANAIYAAFSLLISAGSYKDGFLCDASSFHPRKVMMTGEGGMITTNEPDQTSHIRALWNHGQDPETTSPEFIMPGFNYRMTEFQAALGLTQMAKLDRIISARRQMAGIYNGLLEGTPLKSPKVFEGREPIYQSYVVLLSELFAPERQTIIEHLKQNGVETTIGT